MVKRVSYLVLVGVLLGLVMLLGACNFAIGTATSTPTASPSPTLTVTASSTPPPTSTSTPTITLTPTEYLTPTPSDTPTQTPTPTETPQPTATPQRSAQFVSDQFAQVDVPAEVEDGLDSSWYAILVVNERTDTTNLLTPIPPSGLETVYLVNPSSGLQVPIMEIPASTEDRVYWSPDGRKMVYFLEPAMTGEVRRGGVYLLNLELGYTLRLFDVTSLNPHGVPDHKPVWSPDGTQIALALPTPYDVDIFVISASGSDPVNITAHDGSYNLWPAWSPDGTRIAYVSDRQTCPSWRPEDPNNCSVPGAETPRGGTLHVIDLATGRSRQVSEVYVDGPLTWVSDSKVAFTSGLSDPLAPESQLWVIDVDSGIARRYGDEQGALNLGATWSPGGTYVVYHHANEPAAVVLEDPSGEEVASRDDYAFPRYGFSAAWSPDAQWIAFAGRNGQCPNGIIVTDANLNLSFYPPTTPLACDPSFSPDGNWLAYAGIQFRTGARDGRLDLYVSRANGAGARNLTSSVRGEIRLLGWVGTDD